MNKQENSRSKLQQGIYVALEPVVGKKGIIECYKIHLINICSHRIYFNFEFVIWGDTKFSFKNEIAMFSSFFLNTVEFDQLNDVPELKIDLQFGDLNLPSISRTLKLKPKGLSRQLRYNVEIDAKVLLYFLYKIETQPRNKHKDDILQVDAETLKQGMLERKLFEVKEEGQIGPKPSLVVDLHIENLTADYKHLTKAEILSIQLDHFRNVLEKAISDGIPRLYAVHGIGKGRLKDKLFELLRTYQEVRSFNNSFDKRFGFGATEIIFK